MPNQYFHARCLAFLQFGARPIVGGGGRDPQTNRKIVKHESDSFEYEAPEAGSKIGMPWSESKVMSYILQLKDSLVTPYLRRFELRDTYDQITSTSPPQEANYWVVAETSFYLVFYDPKTTEFGLAEFGEGVSPPITIGVHGDLVGTFCAM